MLYLYVYVTLFLCGLDYVYGERLKDQIYSSISGSNACFRRLNGTHQAGCTSPRNGAVGVVQMIKGIEDAKWIVTEAEAGPYIAVVNTLLFNNIIEVFMENPDNVAGVLVYNKREGADRAKSFSLESQCPNEDYSDSQCSTGKPGVWNSKGSGLIRRDIPFSIIFSPSEHNDDIDKIEECYERLNKDKTNQRGNPLCSLEMNTFMFGAVNADVCMTRSRVSSFFKTITVCDPIGDFNIYNSLFPLIQENNSKENITMVTARVDATSLFDGISPGAASSVVGFVSVLTTAALLSKMIPDTDMNKYDNNVLFTFFSGESFDYIGSQRIAYELNRTKWPAHNPLSPENIKLHVEVGQIGGSLQDPETQAPRNKWPMYAYTYNEASNFEIQSFVNDISTYYNQFSEAVLLKLNNTPPSSIHSFRKILKKYTDTSLPELLITDHEETFTNMYYNSALDEYYQIGYSYKNLTIGTNGIFETTEELISNGTMKETDMQVKISRLVTSIARTLYKRVTKVDYTGELTASAHLIDELMYCFTHTLSCKLVKASILNTNGFGSIPDMHPTMYTSVASVGGFTTHYLARLLVLLAGKEVTYNETECKAANVEGYSFHYMKGWNYTGVCMRSTANTSVALSPAFEIPDYDFKSGVYSTWTESVWQGMSARLFVSASGTGATAAAASGFAVTAVSVFLAYWLDKHKHTVFVNAALTGSDDTTSGILRTVNC